jgi:integrase
MGLTIADLCDSVLAEYQVSGRSSVRQVEYRCRCHIKPLIGDLIAETLDMPDLIKYVAARQKQGAAAGTINRELAIIRRGFRLHRKTLTPPMFPHLKEAPPRETFWTRADFDAIAEVLPPWQRPVFHFAFLTGWRLASEVLPLEWTQVVWGDHGGVVLPWGRSKTGQPRLFPFEGPLGSELVTLLKRQRRATPDPVKYVFTHDGERIRSVRQGFINARVRAGRPHLNPHDLRRTAMRNLTRHGLSLEMAMHLTGHKDPNVARRYNILMNDDLEHAMKRMSKPDLPKNGDDEK